MTVAEHEAIAKFLEHYLAAANKGRDTAFSQMRSERNEYTEAQFTYWKNCISCIKWLRGSAARSLTARSKREADQTEPIES